MGILDCLTDVAYGKTGLNVGAGTEVVKITAPVAGRYRIWAQCRHALDDGLRIKVGSTTKANLSGPGLTQMLVRPFVVSVNGSEDIILETHASTGLSGLASGTLFAQKLCEHKGEHFC